MLAGQLPPEIFDLFIDQLSHSSLDLKNCCLVSKSWLSRSRHHLFRHIIVGYASIVTGDVSRLVDTIHEYRASFRNVFSTPEIFSCVQGISIEAENPKKSVEPQPEFVSRSVSHRSLPISSFRHLPFRNLRFLSLDWTVFEDIESESPFGAFDDALAVLPQLEHLMLKEVEIDDQVNPFASLSTRCTKLSMLCIESLYHPEIPLRTGPYRIELCRKVIDGWSLQRSLQRSCCIPASPAPICLRSLYLANIESTVMECLVLATGYLQTVFLDRVFVHGEKLYLLAPYDLRNVTHLSLQDVHSLMALDLTKPFPSLPSLKYLQLIAWSPERLIPLLTLTYKLIDSIHPLDEPGPRGELNLHIEVLDDLPRSMGNDSMDVIDDAFESLLRPISHWAHPLVSSLTLNWNSEVLLALFPKSMASGRLRNGRGDMWWDVSGW